MPRSQQPLQRSALPSQGHDQLAHEISLSSDALVQREAARLYPRWLSPEGVIAYLSLKSKKVFYNRARRWPAGVVVKDGGLIRVDRLRLDAWLESQAVRHNPIVRRRVA